MPDEPLDMLVVRDMPDGSFAVADALQGVRVVQDGFKSRAEAEKLIEDYYLARGIISPPAPKSMDRFWACCCAKGDGCRERACGVPEGAWPEAATMKLTKPRRQGKSASYIAKIVVAAAVAASAANAELRRIQVGTLTCSLSASIGLIVGSQRNVSCLFRGTSGEPDEPYTGTMTRVGLDVGLTTGSVIIWTVFADTNRYKGMLTGTYTGASAEMSIAAGLGANVLVGGSNRTLALQPLSVQGQIGLDIAAGIGSLDLHPSW